MHSSSPVARREFFISPASLLLLNSSSEPPTTLQSTLVDFRVRGRRQFKSLSRDEQLTSKPSHPQLPFHRASDNHPIKIFASNHPCILIRAYTNITEKVERTALIRFLTSTEAMRAAVSAELLT
eukprot:768441-Hanusia_phi.AAC.18